MNRREILLDDEANQVLDGVLDEFEKANAMELRRQKEASEASFRESNCVDWEDVKRRNGL